MLGIVRFYINFFYFYFFQYAVNSPAKPGLTVVYIFYAADDRLDFVVHKISTKKAITYSVTLKQLLGYLGFIYSNTCSCPYTIAGSKDLSNLL